MARIVAVENVTLDGVVQAPGRADEDTRGGFTHGGWAQPYQDHVLGRTMGEGMGREGALLLGRRTYGDFLGFWPHQPENPFTTSMNAQTKYVVSRSAETPTPWANSTLLAGDAAGTVAELRRTSPVDLTVIGSADLVRSLLPLGLVDELMLIVHPVVLGSGTRLFGDGTAPVEFELAECTPTTTGVLLARYRARPLAERIGNSGVTVR